MYEWDVLLQIGISRPGASASQQVPVSSTLNRPGGEIPNDIK